MNSPVLDLPARHGFVVKLKPLEVNDQSVWQALDAAALDCIHLLPQIYDQRQVCIHTILTLPQGNYHICTVQATQKAQLREARGAMNHLSAGFLAKVLVVAFHQLALHVQVQRLLQCLLPPDVQTQLYQTNKLVKLLITPALTLCMQRSGAGSELSTNTLHLPIT